MKEAGLMLIQVIFAANRYEYNDFLYVPGYSRGHIYQYLWSERLVLHVERKGFDHGLFKQCSQSSHLLHQV